MKERFEKQLQSDFPFMQQNSGQKMKEIYIESGGANAVQAGSNLSTNYVKESRIDMLKKVFRQMRLTWKFFR